MAEAVVKVRRNAGELGRQVGELRTDVGTLLQQLDAIDPRVASAVRAIETYRSALSAGTALSSRETAHLQHLSGFAERQALPVVQSSSPAVADTLRTYLAAALPAPPSRPAAVPAAAPPGGSGPVDPGGAAGSRPLTPEERAAYRQRGYSDDELERATMLREGTLLVRPRPPRASTETDPGPAIPDSGPPQERARPAAQPAPESEREQAATDEAIDRSADKTRKRREQLDLSTLSERELRREWQRSQVDLRTQDRDLDRAIGQLDKLKDRRRRHLVDDETVQAQRDKVADYRQGRGALTAREAALRQEAGRRRLLPDGDKLVPMEDPGGGALQGLQRGAGALLTGAGLGSGSLTGTLMGVGLGTVTAGTALPLVAGMIAAQAWGYAKDSYGRYVAALQQMEPVARITGGNGTDLVEAALENVQRFKTFTFPDLFAAAGALGRGTGSTDLSPLLPVASATGQDAASIVQQHLAMMRVATTMDDQMPSRLLREFGVSSIPTRGGGRAGEQRALLEQLMGQQSTAEGRAAVQAQLEALDQSDALGYDPALSGHFNQAVLRAAAGQMQPLTRVPLDALGAQVGAATYLEMPGIGMDGPIGIDTAAELVAGVNAHVGRGAKGGGALDDVRTLAVTRLRGTEMAQRLKEQLDIDLDTIPGTLRAMERAPELAQRGFPEIARTMLESERGLYQDPALYEMALRKDGKSGELAHFLATRDTENLYGIQPAGVEKNVLARSEEIADSLDVQRIFERTTRDDVRGMETGLRERDAGLITDEKWNNFTDAVVRVLSEKGTGLTAGVLDLLTGELRTDRGTP